MGRASPVEPVTRDWVMARFAVEPAGIPASYGDDRTGVSGRVPLVPAAVLVGLVDRCDGLTVLLTRRSEDLADHAGQIGFPGGRVEPGDATPEQTALRESHEEVGLPTQHVSLIGRLSPYITRTSFAVTPVVGVVDPPLSLVPDPAEVAEIFEVPLAFLLDPRNHRRERRRYDARELEFHAIPWGDYYIWGATAGMLLSLYERLCQP